MKKTFRVLGVNLTLDGPGEITEGIGAAYARFEDRDAGRSPDVTVRCTADADGPAWLNGNEVPLVPGVDRTRQVYALFLTALLDRVGTHVVLHCAALADRRGDAFLVAAPAGHGKSTMALELARRGYTFLTDDYAPFDLQAGTVLPYPRRVGVDPDGKAPIASVFREAAGDEATPRLMGKALLDVGEILGERALAAGPAPVLHAFFLTGPGSEWDTWNAPTRLRLACRIEDRERIAAALHDVPGLSVDEEGDAGALYAWRVGLDHRQRPTPHLEKILVDPALVLAEKYWDARPDFDGHPEAFPMRRREAAELLGRDLVNRRPNGRLMHRYGGQIAALFLDLAGALRHASCHRIRVGDLAETADRIEDLVSGREEEDAP
jgi:hypothetical protein